VEEGLLYKKRGLGLFVSEGAVEKIKTKRQKQFYEDYIRRLVAEARKLGLNKEDVEAFLERGFQE
jgi:DNA-binding transcriptional regulator YhcF (GntR family)